MKIDFSKKIITQDDGKEVAFKDLVGYTIYDGVGILSPDKTKFIFTESKDADIQTITLGTVKEDGTTELDPSKKPFVIDGQAYFIENGVLMKEPKGPFFATTEGKKGSKEDFANFSDGITVDTTAGLTYYEQKTISADKSKAFTSRIGISTPSTSSDKQPLIKVENSDYGFKVMENDEGAQILVIKPTPEMEESFKAQFGDPDTNGFYEIKTSDCMITTANQIEVTLDGGIGRVVANGGQIKFVLGDKEQIVEASDRGFDMAYSTDAISKLLDAKDTSLILCENKPTGLSSLYSSGHVKYNSLPFDFIKLLNSQGHASTGAPYSIAKFGSTEVFTCDIEGKPFMMINDNGVSYVYHDAKFLPLSKETEAAKFKQKETGLDKFGLFYTVASKSISDQISIAFDPSDPKQLDLMKAIHDFDLKKPAKFDITKLPTRSPSTTYTPIKTNKYKPFGITATTTKPEPEEIKGEEIKEKDKTDDPPPPPPPGDDKKKKSAFWDTMASGCAYTSLMAFIGSALLGMPIFAFIGVLLLGATFMCKGFSAAGGFGAGTYDTSGIDTSKLSELDKTKDKDFTKAYEKGLKLGFRKRRANKKFRKRAKKIADQKEELDKLKKLLTPSLSAKERKNLEDKIEKIEDSINGLEDKNKKFIENASYDQLLGLMGPKPATVDALTVRDFDDRIIDQIAKKALQDIQKANEGKDVNYTALPKELRETLGKLTPAERALVLDSLDEASVKIYKDTYSEEIKQKERDIFKEKSDFLKANPNFDFENPALELKLTDFTKVTKKIDGKDVDFYTYELTDPTDPTKKIKHEISDKEMGIITKAKIIIKSEKKLDDEKNKFNKKIKKIRKNVPLLKRTTGIEKFTYAGAPVYIAVDKDGHHLYTIPEKNLPVYEAALDRQKLLTPLLQRRKAIEEYCDHCDSADYTKAELEKAKTIKDLQTALKPSKESKTVLKPYKKKLLDASAIEKVRESLKKDGFTDKQINKIVPDGVTTKAQAEIVEEIEKEEKAYKKNVELKDKLIEENPELQDKLAKLMQGKTPEEQEKIKVAMEEMVRNKKLNSLQKLIAFCDHYTEDKTSDFYAWRTMDETEDEYETETITDSKTGKTETRVTDKIKNRGSISTAEPPEALRQTEDPSKYDYGTAEEEWTSEQLKKKKKKKAKDVTEKQQNL